MGLGVSMGPSIGVPGVTLDQEHISVIRSSALAPQPADSLRNAILALRIAQIPGALRHAPQPACPTNPKVPARAREPGQNRIPLAEAVPGGGPALPQHHCLVFGPQELGIVVLHVASLELDCATARLLTQDSSTRDRAGDAGGAVRHGDVTAALVEAVGDIVSTYNGVVVVGGVGG